MSIVKNNFNLIFKKIGMEKQISNLFQRLNDEIIKYNPYYNKELVEKAFLFACKAHN
jgi:hypothetical protein